MHFTPAGDKVSVLNNHGMLSMATWRGLLQLYNCASDPSKAIVRPVRNGVADFWCVLIRFPYCLLCTKNQFFSCVSLPCCVFWN